MTNESTLQQLLQQKLRVHDVTRTSRLSLHYTAL